MRLWQLKSLSLGGTSLVVLALLLLSGGVMAQEEVTVQLDPVGESGVSGTATLTAVGDGTNVAIDVEGLASGANARTTMHAGTCAMPSASFAALPNLNADATGKATTTGSVLFRGTENIALEIMTDGEHIIAIQTEQTVACGTIPKLTSAPVTQRLPETGGAVFPHLPLIAVVAGALGLCALPVGLFLWQHNRPRHRF